MASLSNPAQMYANVGSRIGSYISVWWEHGIPTIWTLGIYYPILVDCMLNVSVCRGCSASVSQAGRQAGTHSINQSINQLVNQESNQHVVNQCPVNLPSIRQAINQSIHRLINQFTHPSISHGPINQMPSQSSLLPWVCRSMHPSTNQAWAN